MIRAINDRVVVRHEPQEARPLPSGVLLPPGVRRPGEGSSVLARVVSAGPGRKARRGGRVPMQAQEGALVWVQEEAGAPVEEGGVLYRVLRDDGILAVVEEGGVP